jgi:hypothetical protein
MIAIFYDRKNKREVSSGQLMEAKLMEEILTVDGNGCKDFAIYHPDRYEAFITERMVGELAYKSPNCPKHKNWDVWTNTVDLVFLRMEE